MWGNVLLIAAPATIGCALTGFLMWLGMPSTSVTLTEPAERGEILHVGEGRLQRTYVVRQVLNDLTLSNVVLVARYRRWHRWRLIRRWM